MNSYLPPAPNVGAPVPLPKNWEKNLLRSISSFKTQKTFIKVYLKWQGETEQNLSDEDRYLWLECIHYYVRTGQWTAIVDDRPSRVLYPIDVDAKMKTNGSDIPKRFRISSNRGETSNIQKQLFEKFGILAVDHTDQESPIVLKQLYFLLQNGFTKNLIKSLTSFRYVFSFAGHDSKANVAAYHHQMKSISIGGVNSYSNRDLSDSERIDLLAALAHEIGHAFLFDRMSPEELRSTAERFGPWRKILNEKPARSFFSKEFFQPYEMKGESEPIVNLTTQYAARNVHEWFADAFAAKTLIRLGEANMLGEKWRELLKKTPTQNQYWVNYNNISPQFSKWLDKKLLQF